MIDVFDFFDYHKFLRELIKEQKKKHPFFSYRYLSAKVGLDASNIVKIIQGKRALSKRGVAAFCKYCKFNRRQEKYFETMVKFGKTKSDKASKVLFEELLRIKEIQPVTVDKKKYKFYKKWYYTAIAALLYYYDFRGDYAKLAKQLNPGITAKQAKETIKLLENLKFIQKDSSGRYVHTDTIISTGREWHSIAIKNFQEETLKLAMNSLENQPKEVRDVSTLSITVSKEDIKQIKEVTEQYRKSVLKIVDESENPDNVYQLNIQFFPLTNIDRGKNEK